MSHRLLARAGSLLFLFQAHQGRKRLMSGEIKEVFENKLMTGHGVQAGRNS